MVAAFPPLLSDQPPDLAKRAEFGDRFHYWRGASGQRYLFSLVPPESLADFRSAIVIVARAVSHGHLAAHTIAVLDDHGDACGGRGTWPPDTARADVVLIHFLAASHGQRLRIVEDISGASLVPLAA